MGAQFDEAGSASPLPRPEPALIEGDRSLVDGGVVLASVKSDVPLTGFRSLPARLGGGFIVWSSSQTFKAADFLGELKPIAPAGSTGGARPWLTGVLLRTDRGLVELDPASLTLKRFGSPGLVDALATDARRAARLDALGRASFTVDGGATWTDVMAERGSSMSALREEDNGILLVSSSFQPPLRLAPGSAALEVADERASDRGRRVPSATFYEPPGLEPPSSRSLAQEIVAHAVAAGALLPGDRALVAKPRGLALLSASTARTLSEVELTTLAEHLTRCQPFVAAAPRSSSTRARPDVLLLCAHARGAHVLRLDGDMASPKLEATFPDPGVFVSGERGRVAFAGRCGRTPPSSTDFRPEGAPRPGEGEGANEELLRQLLVQLEAQEGSQPAAPQEPPSEETDPPPDDPARVCVRAPGGHWLERRLTGPDALRLYRWLPGDDGTVTALVLYERGASPPAPAATKLASSPWEGVRVVRVEAGAAALERGLFPAVLTPSGEPPVRAADPDFWLEDDGSLRGWVNLPSPGDDERPEEPPPEAPREGSSKDGPKKPILPLSGRSGGRVAGVRVGVDGKVTLFAPPPDTEHVAHGGRFGLAMAVKDEVPVYFETTDGGRSWVPVEGPPFGRMELPFEGGAPFACSPLGCVVRSGVVRLGWGGPPPTSSPPADDKPPASELASSDPVLAPLSPPVLTCRFEGETEPWAVSPRRPPATHAAPGRPTHSSPGAARGPAPQPAKPPAPLSILTSTSAPLGSRREGAWSAEVIPPFSPGSSARQVSLRDASLGSMHGFIAPILTAGGAASKSPVDLLLLADKKRLRLSAASPSLLPFEQGSRVAVVVELPGGDLAAFDADRGVVSLVSGALAARPALRLARVTDAARTRLTLARSGDGLAVVGYSTSSGEVFAGALDMARAEVSPLRALGSLRTLGLSGVGACGRPGGYRFLADVQLDVRVVARSGRELIRATALSVVLVSASGERLCAEGVEAKVPHREPLMLSAVFGGSRAESVIRSADGSTRVTCSLEAGGDK
jgi:hypothetical protein